jgi:DNA recombination protein RmuC
MEILSVVTIVLFIGIAALLVLILVRLTKTQASTQLDAQLLILKESLERFERVLHDEFRRNREESSAAGKESRAELSRSLTNFSESFAGQLGGLTQANESRLERMRETVESRLRELQQDNSTKLDKMRETVDEKLHATLELRLGASFKLVSDRLEAVYKGLGEMQTLATDVGGLKKVLMNIKTRGTWGEIQLGNLLEQVLTPEQFARNIATKRGSGERVEFAIKLPGRDSDAATQVWLPIDAKFPQEDYQRLVEAQDQVNPTQVEEAGKALEARIKLEAKTIRDKYVDPPGTTDFAILFLPTEGLYAEVLRRPGLVDGLQRDYRVVVTGPMTLSALLNSLQMGFRTLVIEKRSSEVWSLLGAVKSEFGKFGDILDKTHKKLQEATTTIESATSKTRTIERRLRDVQLLPSRDADALLDSGDADSTDGNGTPPSP